MSWFANKPLLSVVVPAYRVEAYLSRCLDSILAEPAAGLEVIVVDDHSPDRTGQIADGYARRDPRVRVRHLTTNVGPGRARNAGLADARGDYLWFIDGDDWLPVGSVAAVLGRLVASRPDVLIIDHAEVGPNGAVIASTSIDELVGDELPGPLSERPQLLRLAHSASTKLVHRGFLNQLGLRFHPGWYEDSAYSHPLLLGARRIDTLNRVCYYYRHRPSGDGAITKSLSDRHFDVFAQYQRMWAAAQRTGPAYQQFRPELFRLMINHLLVIVGNDRRVPPHRRREFFRRVAGEYWRWLPAAGYRVPGGLLGIKHRLVRWDAYLAYAALRAAWRAAVRLSARRRPAPAVVGTPVAAANQPDQRRQPRPSVITVAGPARGAD